jgi:transcriptional regulator with XRE-family HTH domain
VTLSQAIKAHRAAAQISQTKLAQAAGLGVNTIIGLESPPSRGGVAGARIATLARIAEALGISLSELLHGVDTRLVQ